MTGQRFGPGDPVAVVRVDAALDPHRRPAGPGRRTGRRRPGQPVGHQREPRPRRSVRPHGLEVPQTRVHHLDR